MRCSVSVYLFVALVAASDIAAAAPAAAAGMQQPLLSHQAETTAADVMTTAAPSVSSNPSPEAVAQGLRECNAKEKRRAACLDGQCVSLQTSIVHSYLICRCPAGRMGKRCEERAPSPEMITIMALRLSELPKELRCRSHNYNILMKGGYESSFVECLKYEEQRKAPPPPPAAGSGPRGSGGGGATRHPKRKGKTTVPPTARTTAPPASASSSAMAPTRSFQSRATPNARSRTTTVQPLRRSPLPPPENATAVDGGFFDAGTVPSPVAAAAAAAAPYDGSAALLLEESALQRGSMAPAGVPRLRVRHHRFLRLRVL